MTSHAVERGKPGDGLVARAGGRAAGAGRASSSAIVAAAPSGNAGAPRIHAGIDGRVDCRHGDDGDERSCWSTASGSRPASGSRCARRTTASSSPGSRRRARPRRGARSTPPSARCATPLPAHKRAEILVRVAGALGRRADEAARQISAEAGKPLKAARVEVARAMSTYTMAAVEARKLAGEMVPMDASQAGEGKLAFTLRVPIGVVGAISPFNFPLNLVAHKIAPALAAGCAVVLKPASQTPLSALLLAELEHEAGLPPGWLNVARRPGVARSATSSSRTSACKLITFTGSGGVGWKLRERAPAEAGQPRARQRDAGDRRGGRRRRGRRRRAAPRTRSRSPARAASRCSASTSSGTSYDEFLHAFVPQGRGARRRRPGRRGHRRRAADLADERDRVLDWIEEARAGGAEILTGGTLDGDLLRPTVVENAAGRREGRVRGGVRPGLHAAAVRHARRGDRARERDALRPPGRDLHASLGRALEAARRSSSAG